MIKLRYEFDSVIISIAVVYIDEKLNPYIYDIIYFISSVIPIGPLSVGIVHGRDLDLYFADSIKIQFSRGKCPYCNWLPSNSILDFPPDS